MKELARLMLFDFRTMGGEAAVKELLAGGVFVILLGLFVFPAIFLYVAALLPLILISPLTAIAEKSGFNKLYGVLPVARKSIYRARFLYIFTLCVLSETAAYLLALISFAAQLYRVLPVTSAEFRTIFEDSFSLDQGMPFTFRMIFGAVMAVMLITAFFTMIKLVKGSASTGLIGGIAVTVLLLIALAFFVLNGLDMLPVIELKNIKILNMKPLTALSVVKCVIWHAAAFGICAGFGEITANKLAEREL